MKELDILQLWLDNTGLGTSPFRSPEAVIGHLGAVQAQDFLLLNGQSAYECKMQLMKLWRKLIAKENS